MSMHVNGVEERVRTQGSVSMTRASSQYIYSIPTHLVGLYPTACHVPLPIVTIASPSVYSPPLSSRVEYSDRIESGLSPCINYSRGPALPCPCPQLTRTRRPSCL